MIHQVSLASSAIIQLREWSRMAGIGGIESRADLVEHVDRTARIEPTIGATA
jgi:hypothetical protein